MQRWFVAVLVAGLAATTVLACGAHQDVNPNTGLTERVWQAHDGADYEVYWNVRTNGQWGTPVRLSDNTIDDTCPRLAFDSEGTRVVWKAGESTPTVVHRGRDYTHGWQSSSTTVSSGTRSATVPWVSVHGGETWVAWLEVDSSGTYIMAGGSNGPEPWPFGFSVYSIGTTSFSGAVSVELHSDAGHMWVVWIDSTTQLGYSEFNGTSWGGVQFETYAGATDLPAARERVRLDVTQ